MSKNKILWLEDEPDTIEDLIDFCEKPGFKVDVVNQLPRFADTLKESSPNIALIILDIMIFGIGDLSVIGKPQILTNDGYDAGWRILEFFLRTKDSPYKDIPVLIVSVKSLTKKQKGLIEKLSMRGKPIEYVEKNTAGWRKDFKKKFEGLIKGAQ